MKYYPVVHDDGRKEYVDTQAQARALGMKNPEPFDIPVDKDGLRNFVNTLLADIASLRSSMGPAQQETKTRSAFTQAEVDAMFEPRSAKQPKSLTFEEMQEFILDTDDYPLANVIGAVLEKVARLKREVENATSTASLRRD